jgi:hypothetical protein
MIVGLGRAIAGVANQRCSALRKTQRQIVVRFENSGVAVGGLATRLAPVYQRDALATLEQGMRGRRADDAGSENNEIKSALNFTNLSVPPRHLSILLFFTCLRTSISIAGYLRSLPLRHPEI